MDEIWRGPSFAAKPQPTSRMNHDAGVDRDVPPSTRSDRFPTNCSRPIDSRRRIIACVSSILMNWPLGIVLGNT